MSRPTDVHPRDYPVNAEAKARAQAEYPDLYRDGLGPYNAAQLELRWCWEEIAQLNASIVMFDEEIKMLHETSSEVVRHHKR